MENDKLPDSDPDGNLSPLTSVPVSDRIKHLIGQLQTHPCECCECTKRRRGNWALDRSHWM